MAGPGNPADPDGVDKFAFSGLPQCAFCYWYIGANECRAFSMKEHVPIPQDIMENRVLHKTPHPGDNGRMFVPFNADPPPEEW